MIFIALMRIDDPVADRLLHGPSDCSPEPAKKPESRLARQILRLMAGKLTGGTMDEWIFSYDPGGRPRLLHQLPDISSPNISLSHSGPWVACAISSVAPVGIDIERHRTTRNFPAIAEAGFGPEERRRSAAGSMSAFYRIWTIREAIAKATGEGLAQATNGLDYAASGPETGSWTSAAEGRQWGLTHLMPLPDMSLSVAAPEQAGPPRWWPFGWDHSSG